MASNAKVEAQLIAQLLALATSTRRRTPHMIAATGMATRFRVWVLVGLAITEYDLGPVNRHDARGGLECVLGLDFTVRRCGRALERAVQGDSALVAPRGRGR